MFFLKNNNLLSFSVEFTLLQALLHEWISINSSVEDTILILHIYRGDLFFFTQIYADVNLKFYLVKGLVIDADMLVSSELIWILPKSTIGYNLYVHTLKYEYRLK